MIPVVLTVPLMFTQALTSNLELKQAVSHCENSDAGTPQMLQEKKSDPGVGRNAIRVRLYRDANQKKLEITKLLTVRTDTIVLLNTAIRYTLYIVDQMSKTGCTRDHIRPHSHHGWTRRGLAKCP